MHALSIPVLRTRGGSESFDSHTALSSIRRSSGFRFVATSYGGKSSVAIKSPDIIRPKNTARLAIMVRSLP